MHILNKLTNYGLSGNFKTVFGLDEIKSLISMISRDGGGHWTVNYTGNQSFITLLSYSLA